MSKYEFIKTSNIVSNHKKLVLEYDQDYSGEMKQIEVKVYPYTVKEKAQLQTMHAEAEKLLKEGKEKEATERQTEATYQSALLVFQKDEKAIDLETIKAMPSEWLTKAIYKALEFEGITQKQIETQIEKKIQEA